MNEREGGTGALRTDSVTDGNNITLAALSGEVALQHDDLDGSDTDIGPALPDPLPYGTLDEVVDASQVVPEEDDEDEAVDQLAASRDISASQSTVSIRQSQSCK